MIKVGFIGVGGISLTHLENIHKNEFAEITAVCDVSLERAKQIGDRYGVNYYVNYDDLLEAEAVDALFVCVPPFAHGEIEEKAAARNIHLMVEKPVGLNIEQVKEKEKAIKNAGIICGTGYCLRYLDTIAKAKEYLKGKEIALVRGHYFTSFVQTPWYRKMELSGGQLVEQSTHTLDLIRYLAGDIVKVYADVGLQVMQDIPEINIPDVTSVNFTLDSGAIGNLTCTFTQADHTTGIEILGHDYRLIMDGTSLTIYEKDQQTSYESTVNFYLEQDNAFIDAIRLNKQDLILSPYENAVKTLAVTLAANKSGKTGLSVHVDELFDNAAV